MKRTKKQDGATKVLITMRKTFEASQTFDVTDGQMAELEDGINPFGEFLEWMIDSWEADEQPDFEARLEDGEVISPFAFPFADEGCKDAPSSEEAQTEALARKVIEKAMGMEDGAANSPDKLLAGLAKKGRLHEKEPATALFHIWLQSSDKEAVGQVLHLFTGVTFQDFLNGCLKQEGTGK